MARKTRKTRRRVKRVKGTRRIRRIRRIKTYYKGGNRRQNIRGGGLSLDNVVTKAQSVFGSVKEQAQGLGTQAQAALGSVKEQTLGLGAQLANLGEQAQQFAKQTQARAQALGPGSPQGTTNPSA